MVRTSKAQPKRGGRFYVYCVIQIESSLLSLTHLVDIDYTDTEEKPPAKRKKAPVPKPKALPKGRRKSNATITVQQESRADDTVRDGDNDESQGTEYIHL